MNIIFSDKLTDIGRQYLQYKSPFFSFTIKFRGHRDVTIRRHRFTPDINI